MLMHIPRLTRAFLSRLPAPLRRCRPSPDDAATRPRPSRPRLSGYEIAMVGPYVLVYGVLSVHSAKWLGWVG
ncbi:hypothetical protein [Streptomyces clavuligerus]|uniref:hypothetical protein n=1 Tax=Streptomyces clavuligerus TaxID=1901 RepID=UPI0001851BF0|nr:hypothetical protein [Streptomyces clavuligerus]WDN52802.1 hypothetical protein LL058_13610 [Streptomyces clavuligerus]